MQSISQVSKAYDISTRMLRYYEQTGLVTSIRDKNNAYRYYDEAAIKRVQQITILRKLQIPVKQICFIMNNPNTEEVIDIFNKNITELDSEITALSTIKKILGKFVKELEKVTDLNLNLDFLGDDSVLKLAGTLSLIQKNTKETIKMSDLDNASKVLNKLKEVRVIYLPPMTVASAFFIGEKNQEKAWIAIDGFIKQEKLFDIKPDLRVFRIDLSNATGQNFGHEVWVSVPDDYPIPPTLMKKKFHGGQYMAHLLGDDGFLTYLGMQDWINESDKYQYDYNGNLTRITPSIEEIDSFGGTKLDPEEIINYYDIYHNHETERQYDVLFPVKRYQKIDDTPVEILGSKERCGFKASIVRKNKFKIIGFTEIMKSQQGTYDCQKNEDGHCVGCGNCGSSPEKFGYDIKIDGRLKLLNKYRKPDAPILGFGSHDMDSQIRGGWRYSYCLIESDITDIQAFMKLNSYSRTIDTATWLIFEYTRGEFFDAHNVCMKLGYTWNGTISGSFSVYHDGKIDPNDKTEMDNTVYCWYPVK